MAHNSLSEIMATSLEFRGKTLGDSITEQNAILAAIKKDGGASTFDGGYEIREALVYANNSNVGSFDGADTLAVAAQDLIAAANFTVAKYSAQLPVNLTDEAANSGAATVFDFVKSKVVATETSLTNLINTHLYLDGTGNSGKNLTGFGAALSFTPTTGTYGGINRATAGNATWRNKKYIAGVDGGAVATSATIENQLVDAVIQATRAGRKPTIGVAATDVWKLLQQSAAGKQQYVNKAMAEMGFQNIEIYGVPFVYDTAASGISATYAYLVNTKAFKFRSHKDYNFTVVKDKMPSNSHTSIKSLVWMGNLTTNECNTSLIYKNTVS